VVELCPEDAAVEIGPGLGDLTRPISRIARRTIAIEVDRGLVELLRDQGLPDSVELLHADALRTDLGSLVRELGSPVVLLGNLPYSISGRLLGSLLGPRNPFRRMGLMLQAEVADRILAEPRTRRYGVLSVWASLWAQTRRGLELGPDAFEPRPRVRSTLVLFDPVPGPPIRDVPLLRRLVRQSFQHRRKTLRSALRGAFAGIEQVLEETGINSSERAEALAPSDFVRLGNALASEGPHP
jgi:16S rRNA (adenine1518-N6/adenine1519-N6)-dimethyltransferase